MTYFRQWFWRLPGASVLRDDLRFEPWCFAVGRRAHDRDLSRASRAFWRWLSGMLLAVTVPTSFQETIVEILIGHSTVRLAQKRLAPHLLGVLTWHLEEIGAIRCVDKGSGFYVSCVPDFCAHCGYARTCPNCQEDWE